MKALEDEQVQKKGVVIVGYNVGRYKADRNFLDVMNNGVILQNGLPQRTVGFHFCYDLAQLRPIALFVQHIVVKDLRLRFRAHFG